MALPCINCGRALENLLDQGNQPKGGLAFSTAGHYGTKVFDPMDGAMLEISICDQCLVRLAGLGAVGLLTRLRFPEWKMERWKPSHDITPDTTAARAETEGEG